MSELFPYIASLLSAFANWSINDLSETSELHCTLKVVEVVAKGNKIAEKLPGASVQGDCISQVISEAAYL